MSLVINRIEIENFRKFRSRRTIDGLGAGLNIVVEPNETGKSTLLEALRGAFFIRHSARTELTRSYCPTGDDVAPLIQVFFSLGDGDWHLSKQFLKSPSVQLSAPDGSRTSSDEAEERLQHLLGFEKGSTRSFDPDTLGALGLLWVGQASALNVDAPGRIVRDTIHSALQAEVGTVVGGRAFDTVRKRIADNYAELRTATGKATGRLARAQGDLEDARSRLADAQKRNTQYEGHLAELENARARLFLVERDVADPKEIELREGLVKDLEVARGARERLATRKAEHEVAKAESVRLGDALTRLADAADKVKTAAEAKSRADAAVSSVEEERDEVVRAEKGARAGLVSARSDRLLTATALDQGRLALGERARRDAYGRAVDRRTQLADLEKRIGELSPLAETRLDAEAVKHLEDLDRDVVRTRVALEAGATRIEIERHDGTRVSVNGAPLETDFIDATSETRIDVGAHITFVVRPSSAGVVSAAAAHEAARDRLADALKSAGVRDVAEARDQVETTREAVQLLEMVRLQVSTLCVADPVISLAAGAAALKAFDLPVHDPEAETADVPDISALEEAAAEAIEAENAAQIEHEVAEAALKDFEQRHTTLKLKQATAVADDMTAVAQLEALEKRTPREETRAAAVTASQALARARDALSEAEGNATAFNLEAIQKRIGNIDRSRQVAEQRRAELRGEILRLELQIDGEGAKGLTGILADAVEEEQVVAATVGRLEGEAAVLKLLLDRLGQAHDEASRRFLGPVTRRASIYVERILPGSELAFDEGLALATVSRAGLREDCTSLSRGTQEQLAVLTRLAFADLLQDRGTPVSLILDDPLVYSDDARLDAMTTLLSEAAERMQVILFTCRDRAFRHIEGRRITL